MRILIDIGHPGHVHLFKYFAHIMIERGHQVRFTIREKEFEVEILEKEELNYKIIGKHYKGLIGKIWGLLAFTYHIVAESIRFKPDIYLSHGSMYAAFASFLTRKPHISMEDTGNPEQVRLYLPFTEAVLTSTSFPFRYGQKQVFYKGYHELAYLHPTYFTPDKSVLKELGILNGEHYFIVRFVSWSASHDLAEKGMSLQDKRELIEMLKKHGKLFISSEGPLEKEFESYNFSIPADRMHDALAFAQMFVGEGATMASEAAVLGIPAIYINRLKRGYLLEQEQKYGLSFNYSDFKSCMGKLSELLIDKELEDKSRRSRQKLLEDTIDVTALLVRFIENWPQSFLAYDRGGIINASIN